eukprot:CAMPEP_0194267452 /NCGR_PEP_ID=MMETSP0169-20130528/1944_1 /TAXON_ID=218684 /ORGANISM="Corethron pennatum, Strain L29A3" /LENGTH=190 /DNA_ID=CAMNT_0039008285 /DNA_START=225 /DNA_END=797 /DNA_ORIENTATION=-
MTYRSRGRSLFEVIVAVIFTGFLIGFITVLCIGNYFRARRAQERQRQRRLAKMGANAESEQQAAAAAQQTYAYCVGNSEDGRGSSTVASSSGHGYARNAQATNNINSTGQHYQGDLLTNGNTNGRYHYGPNGEIAEPLVDTALGGGANAINGNGNVGMRRQHKGAGQYAGYGKLQGGGNSNGPGSDLLSV